MFHASRIAHGAAFNQAANSKRDGKKPYDWTTDYFDEEFVSSDDRLKEWPDEVDVNQISEDVNTEAYLKKWDEYIDEHRRIGALKQLCWEAFIGSPVFAEEVYRGMGNELCVG